MKVVLLQDLKKVGRKFEIKEVSDGYGRNFLIPKGLAKMATDEVLRELESEKKIWQKQTEALSKKAEELKRDLDSNPIIFKLKVGKTGTLFGSVTAGEIEEKIRGFGMNELKVLLEKPLKNLGEHQVTLDLGRGVETKIKVLIKTED